VSKLVIYYLTYILQVKLLPLTTHVICFPVISFNLVSNVLLTLLISSVYFYISKFAYVSSYDPSLTANGLYVFLKKSKIR